MLSSRIIRKYILLTMSRTSLRRVGHAVHRYDHYSGRLLHETLHSGPSAQLAITNRKQHSLTFGAAHAGHIGHAHQCGDIAACTCFCMVRGLPRGTHAQRIL